MQFKIDWTATLFLLILSIFYPFLIKFWRGSNYIFFSQVNIVKNIPKSFKLKLLPYLTKLYFLAIICFALAFIDPHWTKSLAIIPPDKNLKPSALLIYLLLDQSSSMDEVQSDNSKLTNLKNVTRDFIQHRPEDMIGLISFARRAKVLSPLSFDHKQLINNIDHLQTISKQEEDGTALSYALFKATYLLKSTKLFLSDQASSFKIKDAIIIAVTDGMDNPSALDANNNLRQTSFENVANFAHENGIKLFIINIDPKFTHNNWSAHRRRLQKVTHQTGGDFFTISSANQLPKIYENIDLLQKSSINIGQTEIVESRAFSLYPFLISLGMTLLFISITLKSIYFKVIC